MVHFISRLISFLILKIYCGYRGYGAENIPKKGAVIVASNHASDLDPFAVGVGAFRYFNYMAKEELFENKAGAWWMRHVGCFPVKRQAGDRSAIEEAMRRLKKGKIVLLFPEGTRTTDGGMKPFQPGVGFLSQVTMAPILPVYIKGSYEVYPKGANKIKPAKLSVYYGKPIQPKTQIDRAQRRRVYEDIAAEVMGAVVELKKKADES